MENRIIDHPGAWKAADIAGHDDHAFTFEARQTRHYTGESLAPLRKRPGKRAAC